MENIPVCQSDYIIILRSSCNDLCEIITVDCNSISESESCDSIANYHENVLLKLLIFLHFYHDNYNKVAKTLLKIMAIIKIIIIASVYNSHYTHR